MAVGINGYNPYQPSYLTKTSYTPYTVTDFPPAPNNTMFPGNQTIEKKDNVADGKDDGNIGFWKATGNFLKGVGKFFTSPFTDEQGNFSLGKTIKSVVIGAALVALCSTGVGAVLTPALIAFGVGAGAVGMAKAGYNIATAETDAEAEAAWQSMGSSTTTLALSMYGAKSYGKAAQTAEAAQLAEEAEVAQSVAEAAQAAGADASEFIAAADKATKAAEAAKAAISEYEGISGAFKGSVRAFTDTGSNVANGFRAAGNGISKLGDMTFDEMAASASDKWKYGTKWAKVNGKLAMRSAKNNWNALTDGSMKESIVSAYNEANPTATVSKVGELTTKDLLRTVLDIAKRKAGSALPEFAEDATLKQKAGVVWDSAKTTVANHPEGIGAYTLVGRQTIKPSFYDRLSTAEKQYFDHLPDAEKDKILEAYTKAVA